MCYICLLEWNEQEINIASRKTNTGIPAEVNIRLEYLETKS